jgi:hypothetical protein
VLKNLYQSCLVCWLVSSWLSTRSIIAAGLFVFAVTHKYKAFWMSVLPFGFSPAQCTRLYAYLLSLKTVLTIIVTFPIERFSRILAQASIKSVFAMFSLTVVIELNGGGIPLVCATPIFFRRDWGKLRKFKVIIFSRQGVTVNGVWVSDLIYWTFIRNS